MNACTTFTAITAEEKNEATKILTVDFMSSEETGQETAGSDNERVPPATIFKTSSTSLAERQGEFHYRQHGPKGPAQVPQAVQWRSVNSATASICSSVGRKGT